VGEGRTTVDVADGVEPLTLGTEVIVSGDVLAVLEADDGQAEIGRCRPAARRDDDLVDFDHAGRCLDADGSTVDVTFAGVLGIGA